MATLLEYKCPCCGGAITFDSELQKMKCPYCDTEFEMDTLKNYDADLNDGQPDEMTWENRPGSEWQEGEAEGLRTYICNSCGGEIVVDENTAATSCPFCDSPVVMKGQLSGDLRPDYVIPFRLDKKAATDSFAKHLCGKRLLPKVFKEKHHLDEVKGVYVPFWLFDADVNARILYRATRVRSWSDSNYIYTETKYFSVKRGGQIGFNHVPVDGSVKMADDLMESLEPFDFKEAKDFQTAYLAGYLADKYDVDANESISRANERIRKSTVQSFANSVSGYTTAVPVTTSISLQNSKAKYALYPVWLLNTTWNGQKYTFAMNGQTGKFVGNLPVDKKLAAQWTVGLTALCGAIVYGAAWLLRLIGLI